MCLKNALEALAIKYREYKAAHDRKVYQEMRNKLLKEEAFHEFERLLIASKKPFQVPEPSSISFKSPELEAKVPAVSEKEKKSIVDENAMLQKLINSDLEVIKQTQNKMIEISMLIRQFSVKAFEQQQLTELSCRTL